MEPTSLTCTNKGTRLLLYLNVIGSLLALLLVWTIFSILAPQTFLSSGNFENIFRHAADVGIAALGMTLVIIAAGIDLSIGSIVALSSVAIASVLSLRTGTRDADGALLTYLSLYPLVWPLVAACAGILIGLICGLLNGALVTRLRLLPFIVTLGTMLLFRGIATGVAREEKIDAPTSWLVSLLAKLKPEQSWQMLPPGIWLLLIFSILIAIFLHKTKWGRHVFAVGSNEQTARLCGLNVERIKLLVYASAGAFAGMAGLFQFSRLTVGDPTTAVGFELDVIAAVVIGGGSLSGGEGSILGTLVGALFMASIASGCTLIGINTWIQNIVTGCIIILAVALDRYRHRLLRV